VPALSTAIVRLIQLSFFVLPLGIYVWKQAIVMDGASNGSEWTVWKYIFNWWGEAEATAAKNESYDGPPVCVESMLARYYPLLSCIHLVCTVVFCFHSLCLEYQIWYWSCQGTPTMRQPRTKKVQKLLEEKLGICTVLLGLIVGCTFFFAALFCARPYHLCFNAILDSDYDGNNDDDDFGDDATDENAIEYWVGSSSWYAMGALLATSQMAEVVVAALFYARLKTSANATLASASTNENDRSSPSADSDLHAGNHERIEELWADRCQCLFRCLSISTCFLFGGQDLIDNAQRDNSYQHVAQALADYLETKGTLDVVPTDLFTGLFVLQRIQRQRILQTRRRVFEESLSLLASAISLGSGGDGGFAARASNSSLPTSSEVCENPAEYIDSNHHSISSTDIAKMGLRSRLVSSNDLRGRVANSSRSPSPSPMSHSFVSTPVKTPNGKTNLLEGNPATSLSRSVSKSAHTSSSLIRPPAPPSQHLQQIQGLRQQQSQQNIYRRNNPSTTTNTDICLTPHNTNGDVSFYRATSRQVLNPFDPNDASTLEEGARMCKYALSIYTWMLYVFVHPVKGIPRLVCQCGLERGMADCCRSCCCKICGIMKDRNNTSSQTAASMPLRGRQLSSAANSHYNTNQQPLYSATATATATTSANFPRSRMASSRHSTEESDGRDEIEIHRHPESEDYPDSCGDPETSGDTFCEWHKRALLLVAGIPEADLVYAEFNNKLSSVPYCILLDHELSLVVLSIRGSLSMEDIVTDTLVLPESLEEIGKRYGFDGRGQHCHAGVLACAKNVLRDLQKYRWLERLLEQQYPDYSLRIVGHSLGAGVCTLLGYVLRSRYPSLKVFGFSPPGCTMTWEMATGCDSWSTTFVLDSDIVPRLSVLALEELRDEVLELIGRIKVPKHKVFKNFLRGRENRKRGCLFGGNSNSGVDGSSEENYDDDLEKLTQIINDTLDVVPSDTTYLLQLRDFLRVQDERKVARGETNSKSLRMYPPGKMIHLVRTGEERGCSHVLNQCLTCCTSNSGFLYTPVYISNDDLDEIVVTATMGTDHFIDRMCDELHTLSENFVSEINNNGREAVVAAYPCGLGGGHQGSM